jgi:hypothetical protein
MIISGYLDRWRDAIDSGPLPSAERLARAIATYSILATASASYTVGSAD